MICFSLVSFALLIVLPAFCLTLGILGNCFMLLLSSADFFQNCFFFIPLTNQLDTDQDRHCVRPDLGPNCQQRLSAEDFCCGWHFKD